MKLYVGNLSFQMTEGDLRAAFEAHGDVDSARIVTEQETGRSRGFGFVEMADDQQAKAAIEALNGAEVKGRKLTVNEARPRPERGGFGGGGNRGGGFRDRGGDRGDRGGFGRY